MFAELLAALTRLLLQLQHLRSKGVNLPPFYRQNQQYSRSRRFGTLRPRQGGKAKQANFTAATMVSELRSVNRDGGAARFLFGPSLGSDHLLACEGPGWRTASGSEG